MDSEIEKKFKVSSPKISSPESEQDFNDFHYWQDPILQVEELERLERVSVKVNDSNTVVASIGVKGTMRRLAKDKEPVKVVSANVYQWTDAPKPPFPRPIQKSVPVAEAVPAVVSIPEPVPVPTPQVQEKKLVIIDGKTVDDGNFIKNEKYQYILEKKDDSNFIKDEKYLVLPNGEKVLRATMVETVKETKIEQQNTLNGNGIAPLVQFVQKDSIPVLRVHDKDHPLPIQLQSRNASLPKRNEVELQHNPSSPRVDTRRPSFTGRNSPPIESPIAQRYPASPTPPVNAPISTIPNTRQSQEGSHTTLNMEPIVTPQKTKPDTFWWQKVQLVRAISLGIYTYLTTFDGLGDPKVAALGGKPLLYAILTFSAFDMFFAIVKAWPRRFWVFWNVRDWDALQSISSVWAIIADHELVLDIIPLIGNFALRIYSYRMTELIEDPAVKDTITQTDFTIDQWNNPKYTNFVILMLWGCSIGITLLFHTIGRIVYLGIRKKSPSLAIMFVIKACLFAFDITSCCIFLYVFLVPLGKDLFGSSPDIPLFLSVIVSSPIVTTINNALINLPLVYAHARVEGTLDRSSAFKSSIKKLFSPQVSVFTIMAIYNSVITLYMMSRLELITPQLDATVLLGLVEWNPKRTAVWMIGFNLVVNYLVGIVSCIVYWTGSILGGFLSACC